MNRRTDRNRNPYGHIPARYAVRHKPFDEEGYVMFTKPRRNWRAPLAVVLAVLLLIAGALGVNAVLNRIVRVETVDVPLPGLNKALAGYTILHASDLYGARFGQQQQTIADAVADARYNIVCITGDMLGPDGDPTPFYELIEAVGRQTPVLFVTGENDPAPLDGASMALYVQGAQERGAVYLDAPYLVETGGARLWFTPEDALSLNLDAARATYTQQLESAQNEATRFVATYQLERMDRIEEARALMQDEDACIVLSHRPLSDSFVRAMTTTRTQGVSSFLATIDLVLSGHYNGGQARLPLLGPIYVSGYGLFPGTGAVEGLITSGTLRQHVSSGLGVRPNVQPPMRLFNPPSMTLVRLTDGL